MLAREETQLKSNRCEVRWRAMRKLLSTSILFAVMLGARSSLATASYAKGNLGLGISPFAVVGDNHGIDWGLPISLEAGYHLENGFEVFLHPQFMPHRIVVDPLLKLPTADDGRSLIFGFGGHVGSRYLFLEESIRPYVSLHLAVLGFSAPSLLVLLGPGTMIGSDFFVADSVSLGVRVIADMFIDFNKLVLTFGLGGGIYATVYF